MAAQVFDLTDSNPAVTLNGSSLTLEMEPRTVSLLVISRDKASAESKETISSAAEKETVSSASEKKEDKNRLPLILGITGGAAVLVAAAAAAVFRIRKKQH